MKRAALVMVMFAACGGDDGARPDVLINPGPDYDLSCLDHIVSPVPTLISFTGTVYDLTGVANPLPKVPMATATARTLTDNAQVGMAMSDVDGKLMIDITTTGTPARIDQELAATGFVTTHLFINVPPWMSVAEGAFWPMAQQSRLDALATALGATLDPAKGVVEVWVSDCSAKGEFPQATLQLDGAAAQWAMFGGVGVWIPREQTLQHPQNLNIGSVAGLPNVAPGTHTVTVTAGATTITSTLNVTANAWNVLVIVPGHPLI